MFQQSFADSCSGREIQLFQTQPAQGAGHILGHSSKEREDHSALSPFVLKGVLLTQKREKLAREPQNSQHCA